MSRSTRGVALVVTLLMLSVITVVAVTFLALSRRERTSMTHTADLTDAREMAGTALERIKVQILTPIMATTNMLNGDIAVSRNFINPLGFDPSLSGPSSLTNVNYDHLVNSPNPLSPADFLQNVANLFYDPRPPVYVLTNRPGTPREFRFYLDLNRNGQFDANGWQVPLDDLGNPIPGAIALYLTGDPEWIGVLEKPGLPHGPNNKFIGRYAYIILPVGKSLDLNFIHNMSQLSTSPNPGRYVRNQGFGTYEINLAAFLYALNTNNYFAWAGWGDYRYDLSGPAGTPNSDGEAFRDALSFLQYRYGGDYGPNDTVSNIFGPAAFRFASDMIDGLAHDETALPLEDGLTNAWPGATSRQHFYSLHDFFNRAKLIAPAPGKSNFVDRISFLSSRTNTYDRNTYYRFISQMGIDSTEEPESANIAQLVEQVSAPREDDYLADTVGRINLNYDNINNAARNFVDWDPLKFFTNVGHVLLQSESNSMVQRFGITNFAMTNIMLSPTNIYLPSVHRLLQMAANIYDSTINDPFPSVFVPVVGVLNYKGLKTTNVSGYLLCTNRAMALNWAATNVFGLPAVVGAKKGLPNFNEFDFQTFFQITRKIEVGRPNTNSLPNQTNQMLLLSISNLFGVENWNSYYKAFTNDFQIFVSNTFSATLSNVVDGTAFPFTSSVVRDYPVLASSNKLWHFTNFVGEGYTAGFTVPLYTNASLLTNSRYFNKKFDSPSFGYLPRNGELPVSAWTLLISNRLTFVASSLNASAQSVGNGKVFDIVCLEYQTNLNLTEFLTSQDPVYPTVLAGIWNTNRISTPATPSTPTDGIIQQLGISLGNPAISAGDWRDFNGDPVAAKDKANSIAKFNDFIYNSTNYAGSNLFWQAPFTATRSFVHRVTWQANDPLVHYMGADLGITNAVRYIKPNDTFTNDLNLGRLNPNYQPWLGNPKKDTSGDTDPDDIYVGIKDPGVFSSEDWDFPSQKFPGIGWLGRVHRGTAWQTIYLKAEVADGNRWLKRSADIRMHPTNDWRLLDLFTVAQTPNVSHGQLAINQSGLAAWTAVLGSISVLSNTVPNIPLGGIPSGGRINFTNMLVDPVSHGAQIQAIVDSINRVRQRRPNQVFRSLGELLAVPELTTKSPFINAGTDPSPVAGDPNGPATILTYGFNDEIYERIPRQILSLLKVGDARYVVYAFGQSLKPADKSIVTSAGNPQYFGMCTNYQITGEVYTRVLMKVGGNAKNPRPEILNFNILPAD